MNILSPITATDCIVFCNLLAIHLLWNVSIVTIALTVFGTIPFFLIEIPHHFYRVFQARVLGFNVRLDSFSQAAASTFEIFAVRCMRYAFANLPFSVAKAFFHKNVALSFFRYRLRQQRATFTWEGKWEEYDDGKVKGVWIRKTSNTPPDMVLYYIHGGGYVLGSVWLYLEWLVALHAILCSSFENPAIFALNYTLAPEKQYPFQVRQAVRGYAHVLSKVESSDQICLAGDSAGAGLAMMMLSVVRCVWRQNPDCPTSYPKLVVLISPWTSVDPRDHAADGDYVITRALRQYGKQFAPSVAHCTAAQRDLDGFKSTGEDEQPNRQRYYVWYGKDEALAPEIKSLVATLRDNHGRVLEHEEAAPDKAIHVWPVASYFLSRTQHRRVEGLAAIARVVHDQLANKMDTKG